MVHTLSIYPHSNAVIAAKTDFDICLCFALQEAEEIGSRAFVWSNSFAEIDVMAIGCISFPRQRPPIVYRDCITGFGIDVCFSADIGEEIFL